MASSNSQTVQKKVQEIICTVTSDKMNKSRVAVRERLVKHPVVGKYQKKRTKLMFHDENNTTKIGDEVLVRSSRPLSGRKRFVLVQITRRISEEG